MFEQLERFNELNLKEMYRLSDQIAEFLASKTVFDVDLIMRNISVLEVTLALHQVYDFTHDSLIFDDINQSLVHQILSGKADTLMLRRQDEFSFQNENLHLGGLPGDGLAFALAKAMDNSNQTIVILDDNALNHGTTYEALLEIGRIKPNLTLVLIDEQKSLLRHYNSVNSAIKSVRISKVYTETKRDMKHVLGSNPISRPLLNTLTHFRDAIKDAVIEPTIFSQFGFDYHGPINGQNLSDLSKIFKLAQSMSGPNVIHVQTRVKEKKHRKLEFPAFKTDDETPDHYSNYHETLDRVLSLHGDVLMVNDIKYPKDHFKSIQFQYPEQYHTTNGATHLLIPMMSGLMKPEYKPVISLSAKDATSLLPQLQHSSQALEQLVIIIRDAGLNSKNSALEHGIYDFSLATALPDYRVQMAKDMNEASYLLEYALNNLEKTILRIPHKSEKINKEVLRFEDIWDVIIPFQKTSKGVILSFGPSINKLKRKIEINNLDIGLVNARSINEVDNKIIKEIYENDLPVLIYNCEGQFDLLTYSIQQFLVKHQWPMKLHTMNLDQVDLSLSAKQIKDTYHLNIDDCIHYFNS